MRYDVAVGATSGPFWSQKPLKAHNMPNSKSIKFFIIVTFFQAEPSIGLFGCYCPWIGLTYSSLEISLNIATWSHKMPRDKGFHVQFRLKLLHPVTLAPVLCHPHEHRPKKEPKMSMRRNCMNGHGVVQRPLTHPTEQDCRQHKTACSVGQIRCSFASWSPASGGGQKASNLLRGVRSKTLLQSHQSNKQGLTNRAFSSPTPLGWGQQQQHSCVDWHHPAGTLQRPGAPTFKNALQTFL